MNWQNEMGGGIVLKRQNIVQLLEDGSTVSKKMNCGLAQRKQQS